MQVPTKVRRSKVLYLNVSEQNKLWFHAYAKELGYGTASACLEAIIVQLRQERKARKAASAGTKKKSA